MIKYDFNNLTREDKNAIIDALQCKENEDEKSISERNDIIDVLESEYPFLKPRGHNDDVVTMSPEERYCELSIMPYGWMRSFGLDMCRDIKDALGDEITVQNYRIFQIKEKFGNLRWYGNNESDALENVITKYEFLSEHTCIICGKPATQVSQGWISPYCDECVEKMLKGDENMPYEQKFIPVDEYFGNIGEDRFRTCYGFEDTDEIDRSGNVVKNSVHTTERWNWEKSKWEFYSKLVLTTDAMNRRHELFDKIDALKNKEVNDLINRFGSIL